MGSLWQRFRPGGTPEIGRWAGRSRQPAEVVLARRQLNPADPSLERQFSRRVAEDVTARAALGLADPQGSSWQGSPGVGRSIRLRMATTSYGVDAAGPATRPPQPFAGLCPVRLVPDRRTSGAESRPSRRPCLLPPLRAAADPSYLRRHAAKTAG